MEVEAIKLAKPEPMTVTWDIGRRCNFDCTYCESNRHNTYSAPTSWEELLHTYEFVKNYTTMYNQPNANINFTGGEPTVNPRFWDFVQHIKDTSDFTVGLTSNGTWPEKHIDAIKQNIVGVTLSYHAEAKHFSKQRTIDNARVLKDNGVWLTVNVMMHTDHWAECVETVDILREYNIIVFPTIIGDGNLGTTEWFKDGEGVLRRTSHPYTQEQQAWFFDYHGIDADTQEQILSGNQMPRGCCGNRDILGKCNNCWSKISAVNTNFKGWYCSVNKHFLHIDQHTQKVYHHQTCKAKFEGRGAIGSLRNTDGILNYVLENQDRTIVCPNSRCGCGMCVPKAQSRSEYESITRPTTV